MIDDTYRYFALLGALIFWLPIGIILWIWRGDHSKSISRHIASSKRTILLFALVLALAMGFLLVFLKQWFIPTFHLTGWFTWTMILAVITFVLVALVPDLDGWPHVVHYHLARIASLLLMPSLGFVILSHYVSMPSKMIDSLLLIAMVCLWTQIVIIKRSLDKFLFFQVGYFLCFDVAMILTALIK